MCEYNELELLYENAVTLSWNIEVVGRNLGLKKKQRIMNIHMNVK